MQRMKPRAITADQMADILDQCQESSVSSEKLGESVVTTAEHPEYGAVYFVDSALSHVVMLRSEA